MNVGLLVLVVIAVIHQCSAARPSCEKDFEEGMFQLCKPLIPFLS